MSFKLPALGLKVITRHFHASTLMDIVLLEGMPPFWYFIVFRNFVK